jgi:uroporphyrinogen decarboxylase
MNIPVNRRERFLAAARCAPVDRPPVWVMRQAGRYLPEYQAVRAKSSFAQMVHTPELAAEVTLQPVRRFGLDAAIVFSDILAVPEAMGMPYELREGEGIRMEHTLANAADVAALLSDEAALRERLNYVAQTLRLTRGKLGDETALLGFAGSPWTLACYLIEGRGSADGRFEKAVRLATDAPAVFAALMEKLTAAVTTHLRLQIESGADAVQIFDSNAAACPWDRYGEWSLSWIRRIVAGLPQSAPVILFAKGRCDRATDLAATGARVISVDHSADLRTVADALPSNVAVQGNLAPSLMEGEPEAVRDATRRLLESMRGRVGHIVNLGHGITPKGRPECMQALVEAVRGFR